MRLVAIIVGLGLAASGPVRAAPEAAAQTIAHGAVDWTAKTVTATGSGAPNLKAANVAVARLGAERAAKMDAFRNILEAVRGVRVTGSESVGQRLDAAPAVKAKVEGVLRNFKVLDTKYYSDGGVDVVVQVPLDGVLAAAVLPEASSAVPPVAEKPGDSTGIIVNAKGIAVAPAIAPRLFDTGGGEVYGPRHAGQDAISSRGVVAYSKSLDEAMKDPRVTGNPLVIKALRPTAPGAADLVISDDDGGRLATLPMLLRDARVIIVTD